MKGAPWFKFFPADFMAGAAMLSSEERGSYISLLCVQWSTGGLPKEIAKLERLAGGPVSPDVLAKFVEGQDGKLRNVRLESHREEACKKSTLAKAAAGASWKSRREANAMLTHSGCNADAMQTHVHGQSNGNANAYAEARGYIPEARIQSSESKCQKLETPSTPVAPGRVRVADSTIYSEDFKAFWAAYPRKEEPGRAWKAWGKAKAKPPIILILQSIEEQKRCDKWTRDGGQYIPHPTTWINGRGWENEAPAVEKSYWDMTPEERKVEDAKPI